MFSLRLSRLLLLVSIAITFFGSAFGQSCSSASNCTECIRMASNCLWCNDPNIGAGQERCLSATSSSCNVSVENPSGTATPFPASSLGGLVQVSPQRFDVRLRPGQVQKLNVTVRPARNFPVDVYYLMDVSYSMADDLESLTLLASTIATTIREISTNFQLGFGTFVDKPRAPYRSDEPERISNPCNEDGDCQATYSFRHTVDFTAIESVFTERIREQQISGNLDQPEGGMDALLQVAVCDKIIEWRENARHILVYLTDAGFHFAGDGLLGGVVKPNDGQCHLQRLGRFHSYNFSEILDYPSVGQINTVLRERDIIPIFAATVSARPFYQQLQSVLDSAFVGTLAADSSNIVDLIRNTYNTLSQTVRLTFNVVPGITVNVRPLCANLSTDGQACEGVQIEQDANFEVSITAQSCSDELIAGTNLTVQVAGFGQFVVQLKGVCDCNCTANPEVNSTFCNNGNGTLECGLCICNPGWIGGTCQCNTNSADLLTALDNCPLGGSNNATCSGRGTCFCNTCQCNTRTGGGRIYGSACECDDFSCELDANGNICGGLDRGTCDCGTCICNVGYSGDACDCPESENTCISSLGLPCSGPSQGECVCGQCVCNEPEFTSGQYCEVCTGGEVCRNPECIFTEDCVVCMFASQGTGERTCDNLNCSSIESAGGTSDQYQISLALRTTPCVARQGDCTYRYFVGATGLDFTTDNIIVESAGEDCPDDGVEPWIIIVAILVGLIVLAILALIVIRIIIELRYIVEFRQWKKELEKARFAKNDNPLFQKATEDFVNPAYGK